MNSFISLLVIQWIALCASSILPRTIPWCSVDVSYINGFPDITGTIYNCSSTAPSPYLPTSAFAMQPAVNVSVQIVFNNLVEIDDLQQTYEFDCKIRATWVDNRFNITQLFNVINANYGKNGIEITDLYYNQATPLQIWRPDLQFVDAQSVTQLAESFRIKPGGSLYWSRHVSLLVSQSGFTYKMYPLDTQEAQIRIESYSLPATMMYLTFQDPPLELYQDGNSANLLNNALWNYTGYTTDTELNNYASSPTAKPRIFTTLVYSLQMERKNTGILLRLAIPIMLVACIGGVMFWADAEKRLDFSITLLLTIAALYIAVYASIPLVGYPTKMDAFVFSMFVVLLFSIFCHIVYFLMSKVSSVDKLKEADNPQQQSNVSHGVIAPRSTVGALEDSDDEEEVERYTKQIEQAAVSPTSEAVVKRSKVRRLRSRFFLLHLTTLFGRLIIPVLPCIIAYGFFSERNDSAERIALEMSLLVIFYFLGICFVIYTYSRKNLLEKLRLAVVEIKKDTDEGGDPLMLDLLLLSYWEFLERRRLQRQKKKLAAAGGKGKGGVNTFHRATVSMEVELGQYSGTGGDTASPMQQRTDSSST